MASHIVDGKFQSDKYPTCPAGKVPLSINDATAQDLLWQYAQRRRSVDAEFSEDLEACLIAAGYEPETPVISATAPIVSTIIDIRRHADQIKTHHLKKGVLRIAELDDLYEVIYQLAAYLEYRETDVFVRG